MGNMTLREAAKFFDVSRPTLSKALKSGKLTGEAVYRDGPGSEVLEWRVDPAELSRLFKPRVEKNGKEYVANLSTENRVLPPDANAEVERLRAELRRADETIAAQRSHIEALHRLLPAPDASPDRAAQAPRKRGWWPFG